MATLVTTWCQRGNQVHHRRPVKDGAGVGGLPRVRVCAHTNEEDEVNRLVVAPPRYGRRSLAGGGTERQSSRYACCGEARGRNQAGYAC
jgi:hypothetical protein